MMTDLPESFPSDENVETMREALRDTPGVALLLSRILELAGMPVGQVMGKDLSGFALMLENHLLRTKSVRAALQAVADARRTEEEG